MAVDVSELESAAEDYERQVSARGGRATPTSRPSSSASSRRPTSDRGDRAAEEVPSGDAIAREFQRFLRQRGPESS